jgi:hypothetical protein
LGSWSKVAGGREDLWTEGRREREGEGRKEGRTRREKGGEVCLRFSWKHVSGACVLKCLCLRACACACALVCGPSDEQLQRSTRWASASTIFTARFYNKVLQHDFTVRFAARFYQALLPHGFTTQFHNTVLQHAFTARFYSTILQHDFTTQFYSTVLEHDFTARFYSPFKLQGLVQGLQSSVYCYSLCNGIQGEGRGRRRG